jgi:hypothetical protein
MSILIAFGIAGALMQSPAATQGAALSGRVVDQGSQAPVVGAQVMLLLVPSGPGPMPFPGQPPTSSTDRDGRYRFEGLQPGRYRISVGKAGFAPLDGPGLPDVRLAAGERRDDVDFAIQKGAVIVGHVVDEAGEPVHEAHVMAMQKPPAAASTAAMPSAAIMRTPALTGSLTLMPSGFSATTNDLGEFRLFSLAAGEYYVQAMPRPEFGESHAPRATTMLPTYYPGTSDAVAAQPIAVAAGETSVDVVIRMIQVPAFQVSGVVLDQRGQPVPDAMVKLVVEEPGAPVPFMMGPWRQSRSDASGRFTIANVTSGTYTLLAIAPVVISRAADARGGANGGSFTAFGFGSGGVGGTIGPGVVTETRDGTTIQYRDDAAARLPITISTANVSGLEVIVRPATR